MWHIYKSIWIFTPTFFSSSSASNVIKTVHATRPHCLTSDLKITRIEKNWRESRGWQRKQASQDGNRYATKWNNGEKGSPLIFMRFFLERNTYVTKSIYPQLTIPTLIQVVCMWFIITIIRNYSSVVDPQIFICFTIHFSRTRPKPMCFRLLLCGHRFPAWILT